MADATSAVQSVMIAMIVGLPLTIGIVQVMTGSTCGWLGVLVSVVMARTFFKDVFS